MLHIYFSVYSNAIVITNRNLTISNCIALYVLFFFLVNVDEWLQEAETLSVQDMPRSASSLSVRTDASGTAVLIFNLKPVNLFLYEKFYKVS